MLELMVLGSVGVFLALKTVPGLNAKAAATTKTGTISTNPQTNKNPASAQAPRTDQGNSAAQPWYSGSTISIAAGGVATALTVAGIAQLKDLFTSEDGTTTDAEAAIEGDWDESGYMSSSTDFSDPNSANSMDAGDLTGEYSESEYA